MSKPRTIVATVLLVAVSSFLATNSGSADTTKPKNDTSNPYVYVVEDQDWYVAYQDGREKLTTTKAELSARIADDKAGGVKTTKLDELKADATTKLTVLDEKIPGEVFAAAFPPMDSKKSIQKTESYVDETIKPATEAVTAWETELAAEKERIRVAEEKRKAEEAARQAAAAAAARAATSHKSSSGSAPKSGGGNSGGGGGVYTKNVWTSGWQAQIDACRGAVDITGHYGVRTIAEHSRCGGYSFPSAPGTVVRITGVDAGTYQVVGVVARLNGNVNTTADLPRGYDLLYQTCINGYVDMRFVGLTRIG